MPQGSMFIGGSSYCEESKLSGASYEERSKNARPTPAGEQVIKAKDELLINPAEMSSCLARFLFVQGGPSRPIVTR